MKAFVNSLSIFRICAAFAIIPTLMMQWNWISLILFALGSISDWFDGYLARKYNVCTKLGGVLDHIGDKLLVVNTFIMIAIIISTALLPVIVLAMVVVPIILMISRELYISGLREFLGTQKIEMPVPKARFSLGKIKTTLQMVTILLFLVSFAMPFASEIYLITVFAFLYASLVASLWSAVQYTRTFAEKLKKIK